MDIYPERSKALGWHAIIVDGHSGEELYKALRQAKHQPTAVIARTLQGHGITAIKGKESWHGEPLPQYTAHQI